MGAGYAHDLLRAARDGDSAAQARLVEENSGLIWGVARRFFGRGVEAEDLYQLGCIGFLKAIAGFDESFGTQFSTYAVPKIAGEIRRFLRDDGPVKVSRTLKERAYTVHRAREQLLAKLGREPRLSEISAETGLSVEDIAECERAVEAPDSLQRSGENGLTVEGMVGADSFEDAVIDSVSLHKAISELDEREQKLVKLRYFHNLTQQATAQVLGISQVQVSRIEKRALLHLREIFL